MAGFKKKLPMSSAMRPGGFGTVPAGKASGGNPFGKEGGGGLSMAGKAPTAPKAPSAPSFKAGSKMPGLPKMPKFK
jgi:hypothetical protein